MPKYKAVIVLAKCWHYDPKDKQSGVNCANCRHWDWTRCRDEALLMAVSVNTDREIEELMRHSSYTRGHGGIRQVRR